MPAVWSNATMRRMVENIFHLFFCSVCRIYPQTFLCFAMNCPCRLNVHDDYFALYTSDNTISAWHIFVLQHYLSNTLPAFKLQVFRKLVHCNTPFNLTHQDLSGCKCHWRTYVPTHLFSVGANMRQLNQTPSTIYYFWFNWTQIAAIDTKNRRFVLTGVYELIKRSQGPLLENNNQSLAL